jgi:hypothetical protein
VFNGYAIPLTRVVGVFVRFRAASLMLELPRQANNGESFFAFGGCLNTVDIVGALFSNCLEYD